MKIKSAFISFFIVMVLMNSADAQFVIDGNSNFWVNTPAIVGKYTITIENPQEYSFAFDPEREECYCYYGYQREVIGKKIYPISDELNGEIILSLMPVQIREVDGGSFKGIGKLNQSATNVNKSNDDWKYSDNPIVFYIDGLHDLVICFVFDYTAESSDIVQQRGSDRYQEHNILRGIAGKKAYAEVLGYFGKNLRIKKIGDVSSNQEVSNDQNVTDVQNDSENEEALDNGETTNPFSQESSKDWVVIVGGAAALAGATALAARMFKARRKRSAAKPNQLEPKKANKQQKEKKKKEEDEEEEKFFYILQLNKDVLEIGPEKNDKLVVTAWRVDSAGNRSLAKDATIQVLTSEQGIAISSPSGNGQCAPGISLQPNGHFNDAILNISAAVGGKTLKATARVKCNQQLTLIVDGPTPLTFINGRKYQEALFEQQKDETVGEWVFKPFFLWFTDDPNPTIDPDRTKPVKPPFKPIFKIEAIPDVLEISPPVYHGENVWKADVKLFAEKSVDTNWLFTDGKININITVEEQKVN